MKRKTIQVEEIKQIINNMLENSVDVLAEGRLALVLVLEDILHKTGNYNGFNYVHWLNGGCEQWYKDGEPKDNNLYLGDQTRRRYY